MSHHVEIITSPQLLPTLHHPIPMGTRVVLPDHYGPAGASPPHGTVQGIAMAHLVFSYIVVLDHQMVLPPYGTVQAVVATGPELVGEDGTHWRLE